MVKRKKPKIEACYVRFGSAVAHYRGHRKLTQLELAEKTGLSRPTIANIETGRQRLLLGDVFTFAKALGVNPMLLFQAAKDRE